MTPLTPVSASDLDGTDTPAPRASWSHGLAGLADRLAGIDGTLEVHSPVGGGTVISAQIPTV